jgi:cyanophycinase-like exopeptidase
MSPTDSFIDVCSSSSTICSRYPLVPAMAFDCVYWTVCGNSCLSRSAWERNPPLTMRSSTRFQRAFALSGALAGSQLLGDGMMPASSAACATVRSFASTPKYDWAAAWIP